ncbi:hypothetical protein Barb6_02998 [Bacteroidales bacterium Barb6]|nr:hypothetical protein Barb6_02998 [Bacteroidales bacterium Barb6]
MPDLSFGGDYFASFGYEHADNLHGRFKYTAAVAAEVYYKRFDMFVLPQVFKSFFYFLCTFIGKVAEIDISRVTAVNAVIRDGGHDDLLADNVNLARFLFSGTLDDKRHFRVGDTFQEAAYLIARLAGSIGCINGQDKVARFQSRQSGRHSFVRLGDNDPFATRSPLADESTHPAVFAGSYQLQIAYVLLGNVFRIRV